MNEKIYISIPEAGEYLGLGRTASYNAYKRGEIPGVVSVGRKRLVIRDRFLREIMARPVDRLPPLVDGFTPAPDYGTTPFDNPRTAGYVMPPGTWVECAPAPSNWCKNGGHRL